MKKSFTDRCFKDTDGKLTLGQKPNLPIIVGISASVLSIFAEGKLYSLLELISFGAIFTWSWLEIFSGVNYFRRTLGVLVMVVMIYSRLY